MPPVLVPADFNILAGLRSEPFVLESLDLRHNFADHAASTSSIGHIKATPGSRIVIGPTGPCRWRAMPPELRAMSSASLTEQGWPTQSSTMYQAMRSAASASIHLVVMDRTSMCALRSGPTAPVWISSSIT